MTKALKEHGFAAVETVLIVVIIALIAGVGYWVWKQRTTKPSNNTTAAGSVSATVEQAASGTTAGIDRLTQLDEQSESSIDQKHASTAESNATSTNSAQTNVGGAYNESAY